MPALPTKEQSDFAAQMCSRLCHDLISPVGAIANGLEILAEETDPEMQGQVIELLSQSVKITTAKLRFFRMAFGAPGGLGGSVDVKEAVSVTSEFIEAGKAQLVWSPDYAGMSKLQAKSVLICAMAVSDALVRGGQVEITGDPDTGFDIQGTGPKFVMDEDVVSILKGTITAEHETSRYAPYVLLMSLLGQAGLTCTLDSGAEQGALLLR